MWLVNTGSLSLTMDAGKPWSRTMPSKKARATDDAVYGWLRAMKCTYFEK